MDALRTNKQPFLKGDKVRFKSSFNIIPNERYLSESYEVLQSNEIKTDLKDGYYIFTNQLELVVGESWIKEEILNALKDKSKFVTYNGFEVTLFSDELHYGQGLECEIGEIKYSEFKIFQEIKK